jgi:hypothetical protein
VLYLYLCYYTDLVPTRLNIPTQPINASLIESAPAGKTWWICSMTLQINPIAVVPDAQVIESRSFGEVGSVSQVRPPQERIPSHQKKCWR